MTKDKALAIFEKYYMEWESDPKRMENGYNYEATYAEMMKKVEKEVFQNSVGELPSNKNRKKNSIPVLGKLI